jgi:hypothetical protein
VHLETVERFITLASKYGSHKFKRGQVVTELGFDEKQFAELKRLGLIEPTHNGSHYSQVSEDGWRLATRIERLGDKASMLG